MKAGDRQKGEEGMNEGEKTLVSLAVMKIDEMLWRRKKVPKSYFLNNKRKEENGRPLT